MPDGVVTIYYCPDDEPYERAEKSIKYRYSATTTFFDLLNGLSGYFQEPKQKMTLKDNLNTYWPMKSTVGKELAKTDRPIRFCRTTDYYDKVEEAKEEVKEAAVEEEIDDTRPASARPPKNRELFVHCIFLMILIVHSYLGYDNSARDMSLAMGQAFVYDEDLSIINKDTSTQTQVDRLVPKDIWKIKNEDEMCEWLQGKLATGLFQS